MPRIRPLGNQVVIQRVKAQDVTGAGLVIPELAQKRSSTAFILAMGSGCKGLESVSTGAVVFISGAGKTVVCDGEEFEVVFDKDVIAVLEDED